MPDGPGPQHRAPGPRPPLGDTVAAAPPASFQVRPRSLGGTTPLACSCWYPPGGGRHRHLAILRIRRPGTLPGELRRRRACRLYRPAAARRTVLHLTSRMPHADGAVPVTGRKCERPSSDRAPCRSRRATIPTHRTPMNRGRHLVGWRSCGGRGPNDGSGLPLPRPSICVCRKWWDSRTDTNRPVGRRLLEHRGHPHPSHRRRTRCQPSSRGRRRGSPVPAARRSGHTALPPACRPAAPRSRGVRDAFRAATRGQRTGNGGCATGPPLQQAARNGGEHRELKPRSRSLVVARLFLYRVPDAAGVAVPDQPGAGRAKLSTHQPRRRTVGQDRPGSSHCQPRSPGKSGGHPMRGVPSVKWSQRDSNP